MTRNHTPMRAVLGALAALAAFAAPAGATFPGRNGLIVFESWDQTCFVGAPTCLGPSAPAYDLWVVKPDGLGLTNITHTPGVDTSAVWSPDGQRIAFVSNRNGDYDVYVTDPTGEDVQRLTSGVGDDGDPTWSPNGKRIALINYSRRVTDVVVMRADGSGPRRIASVGYGYGLQWSPDGKWLVFVRVEDEPTDGLYLVRADGRRLHRVPLGDMYVDTASWSPDGQWLTFSGNEECTSASCDGDIWVVRRDGTELRRVVEDAGTWQSYPVWSPDGQSIVYSNGRDDALGQGDIWMVNLDGSENHRVLAKPESYEANLDWQALPD